MVSGKTSAGSYLREEFLVPLKLTTYAVAAALNVPRARIERIAREEKPVTADTALRLGKFFKTGAAFWMNMQARFDLETAKDVLVPQIKKITSYEGGVRANRARPLSCNPRLDPRRNIQSVVRAARYPSRHESL
ncbi:HigA family addiction module antitoxin [Bradyrhizobium sp. CB82]|uniref:HigA family addiction module antitoxin n=1 Tax=Bradyrhizobium sp. CB82 TaxID=3039159 RepID=UPI0032C20F8A